MQRAVFLDRDGVINRMVYNPEFGIVDTPANPDELVLLPNVGEAVAALNRLGFRVIVVSNQPGIAKGRFSHALLQSTTDKMLDLIRADGGTIDAVHYCLHHPEAVVAEYRRQCDCRKPKPGLLFKAAKAFKLDRVRSFMVGDGVTDMLAGRAAGASTLFVSSRKCYVCDELARQGVQPDYMVADLSEAVEVIRKLEAGDRSSISQYVPVCAAFQSTATMVKAQ